MKIIVYAGSFNPITRGHFVTMETAISAVGADKGLFIITADSYLNRKMIIKNGSPVVLSEDVRRSMIESLAELYPHIGYAGVELGGASPSSVKTMKSIIRKYKPTELYCLMGADKLRSLEKWNDIDSIIDNIKIIVASRKDLDIDSIINNSDWLKKNKDRIIVIYPDNSIANISSSEIRKRFISGDDYKELMDEGPYNIFSKLSPSLFLPLNDDKILECIIKYGGRFGHNTARKKVYKLNKIIFDNWDDRYLGNKEYKLMNTLVYKDEFKTNYNFNYNTVTGCYNKCCSVVAEELINEGLNPALLNLASNVRPCGGYDNGMGAQEESLCQMSTLSQSLYQFGNIKYKCTRDANVRNIPGVYPMDINFGGIYSPKVTFFRHNIDKYYKLRDKTFDCSIITVASLSNRSANKYTENESYYFNEDGTLNEVGRLVESNKIRTIFRIALDNGHDSLILGAFGTGVYKLLPSDVSKLFYDILNEPEFKGNFKKVVFAILHKQSDNKFKPFYEWFE